MSKQVALYRLYDEREVLLYVGIAEDPETRWRGHASVKPWWPDVTNKTVEWHSGLTAAMDAETAAIAAEGPAYNVQQRASADLRLAARSTWWEYVQKVTGGATQTAIARRLGLSQPSVNRWRTSLPKSENVITFAKAYGRPPLEALLAAGIVSDEDVQITHAPANLSEVETDELLAEIRRRIKD